MNFVPILQKWTSNDRLIHSFKTMFACLLGFIIAGHIHFQAMQWIIVTTIVVMLAQVNVGSVIQKSTMRFLGTLMGSLIAIFTLSILGNDVVIKMIVVLIAVIFFSYIATSTKSYNEAGTLGAVTVTIILFGQNPTIEMGVARTLEISLGIFIAACVSQFIFPIQAKTNLRHNQAMTLEKIHAFYLNIFSKTPSVNNINAFSILDEEIVKSLIAQRKLALDARREKLGKAFNMDFFQQSLWCEKEIIRSIVFMFYAYQKIATFDVIKQNIFILEKLHREVTQSLQNISIHIEENKIPDNISIHALSLLKKLSNSSFGEDERIALDGFIFCAEILIERLNRLVHLLQNANSM